jgi:hypothetical protein
VVVKTYNTTTARWPTTTLQNSNLPYIFIFLA